MTICDRCGFSGLITGGHLRIGTNNKETSIAFNGELCDVCFAILINHVKDAIADMKNEIARRK